MRNLLLFISILLFTGFIYGQSPEFTTYTGQANVESIKIIGDYLWAGTETGLYRFNTLDGSKTFFNTSNSSMPGNYIRSISSDSKGIIWIGTSQGAARFDGTSWISYLSTNSGLIHNCIHGITVDKNGACWITGDDGISKFDGTNWTAYKSLVSGLPSDSYHPIAIDSKGNKWIATMNKGLVKFDGSTWIQYNNTNSGLLSKSSAGRLSVDASDNIWICDDKALTKFDGTKWTNYKTDGTALAGVSFSSIAIDAQGNAWLGSNKGLVKFNGTSFQIYKYTQIYDYYFINDIVIDSKGNKWVGTSDGLYKFDGSTWTQFTTSNSGLTDNNLTAVIIDKANNKWIASGKGLNKFDGKNWSVFNKLSTPSLDAANINSMTFNKQGSLLIGQIGQFFEFDGVGSVKTYAPPTVPFSPGKGITCILADSKNNYWIGNQGVFKYNGSAWVNYTESNSLIPGNTIKGIAEDAQGNIWAATTKGLGKFDGTNWTAYTKTNGKLPEDYLQTIAIDKAGVIWLGYIGSIVKWDPSGYTSFTSSNSGFAGSLVNNILVDENNVKWIASNNGLTRYDEKSWTVYNVNNSALFSNLINGLAADGQGNLWMATSWGGLSSLKLSSALASVDISQGIKDFCLEQNYPNPFNPSTAIRFQLPHNSWTIVKIYNVLGSEIASIADNEMPAGTHTVYWNGRDMNGHMAASGIYIFRITAAGENNMRFDKSIKMMLAK